jgi:hypothetical protein
LDWYIVCALREKPSSSSCLTITRDSHVRRLRRYAIFEEDVKTLRLGETWAVKRSGSHDGDRREITVAECFVDVIRQRYQSKRRTLSLAAGFGKFFTLVLSIVPLGMFRTPTRS